MPRFTWFAALVLVALGMSGCDSDPTTTNREERFVATMTGANERPNPVNTTATGTATIVFTNDTTITYSITLQNATNINAAHIHIGGPEVSSTILVGLFAAPTGAPVTISNGILAEGKITPGNTPSIGLGLSFEALKGLIRGGGTYVNAHSTSNPAGIIRGQLLPA